MKANKVLKLLQITRPTLCRYVQNGTLKAKKMPSGQYDYDSDSVYSLLSGRINEERKNVLYCRVSTAKQKNDLENQEELLKSFCIARGVSIDKVLKDIGSGINFDRKGFFELLMDVVNHRVSAVYITYKDRLSRISFNLFKNLFSEFGTDIVVVNDTDDAKTIEKEIFKEIGDLIHCFSTKMYSSRRREKLNLVARDLTLESSE